MSDAVRLVAKDVAVDPQGVLSASRVKYKLYGSERRHMPPLQYLGVGLSKTATKSLESAMKKLGFKTLHWRPKELAGKPELLDEVIRDGCRPDFRAVYKEYDFVNDIPHAYFFHEIGEAYPDLKFILTERDEENWYTSMCKHFPAKADSTDVEKALHMLVYGREFPANNAQLPERHLPEFLYKKRFRDWNRMIKSVIPKHRLLVIDICAKNETETEEQKSMRLWKLLCGFVSKPVPSPQFPHGKH